MATEKRERQKAARRAKLEQQAREQQRRKQVRRVTIFVVIGALVIASGAWLFSGSSATTTTTSTTAAPTTTTTAATTTSTAAGATTTTAATGSTTTVLTETGPDWAKVTSPQAAGTAGVAPTIVVPTSAAPTVPEYSDLITGSGAVAKAGDKLTVQYVLATYSSHKVVQSSWTSSPFSFTLGAGQVITGWDDGVVGMRVGGRRELVLPPSYGYGSSSPGSGIAANDTLIFIVDLLKIG
jgi:peptidylprolyl isomerase